MAIDAAKEIKRLEKELKNAQKERSGLDFRVKYLELRQKELVSIISNAIEKHHKGVAAEIAKELKNQELLIKRDVLFSMRKELKKSK